jgi:hypothetical protein
MDDPKDVDLFDGVTFSDLMKDIYYNSKIKQKKIEDLIDQLTPMMTNLSDVVLTAPLIKDYLDIGVKNDDHLLKLASVVQRYSANAAKSNNSELMLLSEDEKLQLMELAEQEVKQLNTSNDISGSSRNS